MSSNEDQEIYRLVRLSQEVAKKHGGGWLDWRIRHVKANRGQKSGHLHTCEGCHKDIPIGDALERFVIDGGQLLARSGRIYGYSYNFHNKACIIEWLRGSL